MDNCERLISQYKDKVPKCEKLSIKKLFEIWANKSFCKIIDINNFYDTGIKRVAMIQILDSDKFKNSGLSENDLKFLSFIIKNEGDGKEYHNLLKVRGYDYKEIYVVMEEKLEYIYSNCGKLFLELVIERGIDKKDYDEENMTLIEYLSRIEALEQKWY